MLQGIDDDFRSGLGDDSQMHTIRDVLQLAHGHLTGQIIDSFYTVYNVLGAGHFESVYVRALQVELNFRGIASVREAPLTVRYRGMVVGDFRVDLLVEDTIIVEVKTAERIAAPHAVQVMGYLRASGLSVGLILNAGTRPTVRRMIYSPRR